MLDLDAIRARVEAATPGPWEVVEPLADRADVAPVGGSWGDLMWGPEGDRALSLADAEFIAHAREDVPALLAEVESLRREVAADDEILAHRQRLTDAVDAIEECQAHGAGCLPHAVQWVERTAAEVERLRALVLGLLGGYEQANDEGGLHTDGRCVWCYEILESYGGPGHESDCPWLRGAEVVWPERWLPRGETSE